MKELVEILLDDNNQGRKFSSHNHQSTKNESRPKEIENIA
jgi:hypothetical protein